MAAETKSLCLGYINLLDIASDTTDQRIPDLSQDYNTHYRPYIKDMSKAYKTPMRRPISQQEANQLVEPGLNGDAGDTLSMQDLEHVTKTESKAADIPPDGGYGWVCVACVFMVNAHTWGLNSV